MTAIEFLTAIGGTKSLSTLDGFARTVWQRWGAKEVTEAGPGAVRRALGNVIARLFLDDSGGMRAIALGPRLEASLMGVFGPRNPQSAASTLTSDALAGLLRELQKLAATTGDAGPVPLVVPPGLRVGVRRLLEPVMPALPVVSLAELPPFVNLTTVALWEMKELKLAAA
jgi:flagellar biosynthesis protein FlhA